ncbi:MAG: hypothetical protein AABM40_05855 [Chloroflexota bacterium]
MPRTAGARYDRLVIDRARSYTIELRSAAAKIEITDDVLDAFAAALFVDRTIAGPVPSVDLGRRRLEVRTCVDATDLGAAVTIAISAFTRAAAAAGVVAELEAIAACVDGEHERGLELITSEGVIS